MTVFANLAHRRSRREARRERWELPDGDFLDVDRHGDPASPTVIVLHGLEGSSRAPYVERMVAAARAEGLSVVAVNFRGCSGEVNRLPRLYHSGDTGDLAQVASRLAAERPGRPLGVAGFSLGGNVAAKWLGERGGDLPAEVRAGAVVSVPFDLAACAAAMDARGGMGWIYRERFLRSLRRKALSVVQRFPHLPVKAATVRACRTFAAFDDQVTAPLHGFASAADYWRRSSSGGYLAGVDRPLLCISAEDDPIVPGGTVPAEAARRNPRVQLELYAAGGHVGFVAGLPWRFEFFAEARAAAFLAAALAPGL
jgi:predicted alpha/beta-fold hydrolase